MKHVSVASYITKWILTHKKMGNFIELYYDYDIQMEAAEVAMVSHSNKLKQILNAMPRNDYELRPSSMLYQKYNKLNGYMHFNGTRKKIRGRLLFGTDSRFLSDEESDLNKGIKNLLFYSLCKKSDVR